MKLKPQFRTMELGKPDSEKRTVTLSFSSEEPYERYWGIEILSHDSGAMDMSRLQNSAPLLYNHNRDEVIGVVESAYVENAKGYAVVRFGNSAKAMEIFKDVEDGILKNVSVGYEIQEMKLESQKDGVETYRVTKWLPLEISVVSVPADNTVGIGRSEKLEEKEIKVIVKNEENKMPEEIKKKEEKVDTAAIAAEIRQKETQRVREINALGVQFKKQEEAIKAIEKGTSVNEFRAMILDSLASGDVVNTNTAEIGMSERDKKNYSFLRALRASITGEWGDAGFEREVSQEVSKLMGREARGFYVPEDILKRDLTNATGGAIVATDNLASSFIEILRNKMALVKLGARTISGLSGNVSIPKQTGAAATAWIDPNTGTAAKSDLTLGSIGLTPKEVVGYTAYSRTLLLQSNPSIEALVMNDLATNIALAIDSAGINGSGASGQPTGILNTAGVGSVSMAAAGGGLTYAGVVQLESTVESLNAEINGGKYLVNATMAGTLKTTEKVSGYPQYILEKGEMNGYETVVSNQAPANTILFGDFSQLIMALWGGLDVVTNRLNSNGMYEISAFQSVDFGVRHAESFVASTDVNQ